MRRTLIAQNNATAALAFSLAFALHEHLHAVRQDRNFTFLARNDVGQIVCRFQQVCDFLFERLKSNICHNLALSRHHAKRNSRAPVAPLALGR